MALKFYNSALETGGVIGTEVGSGTKGALLPKVSSLNRQTGITIHRKYYIHSSEAIGLTVGLNQSGLFSSCTFESASDAEVVGDLTGSEVKYGAGIIVKAEDTLANTETVNGTGGLINLKKVTVADDITGDVYFRAGGNFYIDSTAYLIDSVTSVAEGTEITLLVESEYFYTIGKNGYSAVATSITADGTIPLWLKVTVQPNTVEEVEFSTFSIMTVS